MMDRSVAAFDEIKQGIRTIESLADPEAGELWIGCIESVTALMLPPVLREFMRRYPRVVVHVERLASPTPELRDLCERNLDLALTRLVRPASNDTAELSVEPLGEDPVVIAAGARSHWAGRRKITLGDLADEPWLLTPADCWTHVAVREAFERQGLKMPNVSLMTYSIPLRMSLVASGPYITVFPNSIRDLDASRNTIAILPIDLPVPESPLAIVTVKNRKLNPVAQRFVEHLRDHASGSTFVHASSCAE